MNEAQTMLDEIPETARPHPNRYLARRMAKPINFYCVAAKARTVCLVGDFNGWQPHANPMKRQPDGTWTAQVLLHHGHHQYQFLADGELVLDPNAYGNTRNERDEPVSVIAVS